MIDRAAALRALEDETFDVIVVGGGITGAGVALDAAARGFTVAVLERADWAAGTSSRSSKLVHGGLRYLQHLDLALVREALLERQLMVRLAPHLVKPLPMVVPAFDGQRADRVVGMGLNLYDAMAGRGAERHRELSGEEVVELAPALAGRAPSAGWLFHDCQTDDARLVLTVLGEAERLGALPANRVEVTGLLRDGRGRTTGVAAVDVEAGAALEVRATHVVCATGVWADQLGDAAPPIRPSRGSHVVLDAARLPVRAGVVARAGGGQIFVLPWLGQVLVGTTDHDTDEADLRHVAPPEDDVAFLLEAVNAAFGTALGPGDVAGAFAGVRPLISAVDAGGRSVDISRKAELFEDRSGLVTITGGKLTTWRRMAKLAVDRLVERDARDAPCRTHELPLGQPVDPAALPRVPGLAEAAPAHLAARYGAVAADVLALAAADPALAAPVVPDGPPDLLAEAVLAARQEQARSVGDVLLRRTRLGLLAARAVTTPEAALRVAGALAPALGWDAARTAAEADLWLDEAAAEGLVVREAELPPR